LTIFQQVVYSDAAAALSWPKNHPFLMVCLFSVRDG
jgi:hypothetical protein